MQTWAEVLAHHTLCAQAPSAPSLLPPSPIVWTHRQSNVCANAALMIAHLYNLGAIHCAMVYELVTRYKVYFILYMTRCR